MHVIRLRAPWRARWSPSDARDATRPRALYQRTFHRPDGLRDGQPVWLVLRLLDATAPDALVSRLNGHDLEWRPAAVPLESTDGAHGEAGARLEWRVRIEGRLERVNHLELAWAMADGAPVGSAASREAELRGLGPPPLASLAEVQLEIDE